MENPELSDSHLAQERIEGVFNTLNSTIGRITLKAEKSGNTLSDFFKKLEEKKNSINEKNSEAKELLKDDKFEELDNLLTELEKKAKNLVVLERNNYSEIYAGQ
jgi:predicted hydrocarbon binding protein